MSTSMRFTIPGPPIGKLAKDGYCFAQGKTLAYENRVKDICIEKCDQRRPNYDGQVAVNITAFYPIPSFGTKKKRDEIRGGARPVKKPDLDNIAKIIMDALNHVAWQDDKQVVCLVMSKKYAAVPCVSVGVHYLD